MFYFTYPPFFMIYVLNNSKFNEKMLKGCEKQADTGFSEREGGGGGGGGVVAGMDFSYLRIF